MPFPLESTDEMTPDEPAATPGHEHSHGASLTANTVPWPGELSTVTDPPIASVSSLTIASPSPVPTARFAAWRL